MTIKQLDETVQSIKEKMRPLREYWNPELLQQEEEAEMWSQYLADKKEQEAI